MAHEEPTSEFGDLVELGAVGLRHSRGRLNEEFHRKLYGSRGVRIFREMYDNDPVIGAVSWAAEILMVAADWRAEPVSKEPRALEAAEFLAQCMGDMEHGWKDVIRNALTAVPFGWSFQEIVYKERRGDNPRDPTRDSRYNDGRLGWRKIALRSQESLDHWEIDDETDTVVGLWQRPPPLLETRFIPSRKAVHFTIRGAKPSPEGRSLLRTAYRPWFFKKRLEEFEGIGFERELAGLPVMEVPPRLLSSNASADEQATLASIKTMIQNLRTDERMGLVIPSELDREGKPTGWKFSLATTGGRRNVDVHQTIVRYEQRMAMTFLAQFILLGMDRVGSFALASSSTELFAVGLGALLDQLEETLNRRAVADLMRLNGFPQETWPRLVHGDMETLSIGEIANAVNTLVGAGVLNPDAQLEDFLRAQGGLPAAPAAPGAVDEGESMDPEQMVTDEPDPPDLPDQQGRT